MDGPPPDVVAVLARLLDEAREHAGAGNDAAVAPLLATVETVAETRVPDPDRRERLRHGCRAVRRCLDADDPEAAVAYLEAMARRLPTE